MPQAIKIPIFSQVPERYAHFSRESRHRGTWLPGCGARTDFWSVYICLCWSDRMFAADICPHNKCRFCFMCLLEDGIKSWPHWSCLLGGLLLDQAFPACSPPCSCDMADSGSSGEFSASLTSSTLPPPRTRIFKIIVIGDSGVGKTCLTYRFCAGKFPEKTEATIGVDFRERLVEIDGEKIKVSVLPKREETWPLILQPYNE